MKDIPPLPSRDPAAVPPALLSALESAAPGVVHADAGHCAAYDSDASLYRQVAVAVPRSLDEAACALAACHAQGAAVLARGAGTSMCGQAVNNAVVLDLSAHCNAILALDPVAGSALVEPGVICDSLRDAVEVHGLTFAPNPSTHSRCTLGSMIANNFCGAHSAATCTPAWEGKERPRSGSVVAAMHYGVLHGKDAPLSSACVW